MRKQLPVNGCLLLSAIYLTPIASAQTRWWRTYGGASYEEAFSVQQTVDGGYVVAGFTYSFGAESGDVYLVKTDAQGDSLWTRTYGGPHTEVGRQTVQTEDSGYIIVGYTGPFYAMTSDVYLIKTTASGDTIWTRTYGGTPRSDWGFSVQQTADGGYVVAGGTESFGPGNPSPYFNVYLVKTDASGDTLWTRAYGGMGFDDGYSVQQTTDGGYIIAGWTSSFGAGDYDVYLIKTNPSGDTLWTRTFGGTGADFGTCVQQTTDSGYIIAGYTHSFGAESTDVYLVKTSESGDTLWTRTYGGTYGDEAGSVQQTSDGGYILTAWTESFGPGTPECDNVYLVRTDASGDTLWTRTYGGMSPECGNSALQTSDGGYVVAGYTQSFGAGAMDVYLIKTDADGYVGLADQPPKPNATGRELGPTVVRGLPQGAVPFDAMGRRVLHPKPGIYFVRTSSTAAPRKVLLVK
jgi:hypothetical protein